MTLKTLEKIFSKQNIYHALRGVAYAAAGFGLILCILLIANYIQTKVVDPLNNPSLTALMEMLEEDPQNAALKDQIRSLDLLARKAYFTSQWQLRTGGLLLLGSFAVLFISLRLMGSVRQRMPAPEGCPDADDSWLTAIKARKWIVAGGVCLLATTLVTAIISHHEISRITFEHISDMDSTEALNDNWPNFRGPNGIGVASAEHPLADWDGPSGRGIHWKVEVPKPGYSSPVVWGNRIFLTGGDNNGREVYCFDAENGAIRWQQPVTDIPGSPENPPRTHTDTGYAPSTVATNGRFVCAIFPTGDLICFDMEGNRVWAQNLGVPDNHYGHASSLLIFENLLFVQYDQNRRSRLLALDVSTGETVWRAERSVISWSTPICVNSGNRMELILTNSISVEAYDPRTGVKLWGLDCMGGEMGPSAAYADGWVYAANDYAVVAGIQLTSDGAELVWEYDEDMPDTSSPLATDQYLFIATSYGYIVCLNAKTGETLWYQEFDDGFYASPILAGGRVYAMDLQGVMHVFQADKAYKSIGEPALGEPSSCTPAFVGDRMYVRGEKYLYCITGK